MSHAGPMAVELIPVLIAGLSGGLAMYVAEQTVRTRTGNRFDVAAMWSSLVGVEGAAEEAVGVALHFVVSVGIATGYAIGFSIAGITDVGWAWGLIGGVIHWVAALAFLGIAYRGTDATVPQAAGSPGATSRAGDRLAFFAGHLLFGLIVGVVYLGLHSAGGFDAAF